MAEVVVFLVVGAFIFFAGLVIGLAIGRLKEEDRQNYGEHF